MKERPILLLSNFGTKVTHNEYLCNRNFPLEDPI